MILGCGNCFKWGGSDGFHLLSGVILNDSLDIGIILRVIFSDIILKDSLAIRMMAQYVPLGNTTDWIADDDIPCYQLQRNHIRSCTLLSQQAIQLLSWLTILGYTPLSYNYIMQIWHYYHPRAVPSYKFLEEFYALKVHILNYTVTLKHVNSKSLTQWVIGETLHYHCQRVRLETLKWKHCPLSATVETRHTDGDKHTHSARYRFVSSLNFSLAFSYIRGGGRTGLF